MDAYDAYTLYNGIKLHFNGGYDYFKFSGKSRRVSSKDFKNIKERLFCEKLAKHPDPKGFLIANFLNNPKSWIRDIVYSPEAEEIYKEWLRIQEGLSYIFREDLGKLLPNFNQNFIVNGNLPYIFIVYLRKEITLEALCILVEIIRCKSYWKKLLGDDILFKDIMFKIEKYTPFIQFDKAKFKKIALEKFDG